MIVLVFFFVFMLFEGELCAYSCLSGCIVYTELVLQQVVILGITYECFMSCCVVTYMGPIGLRLVHQPDE